MHPLHHADFELIQEGTPAAEALRANAHVKVTKMGKVARYFQVQVLRKNIKWLLRLGTGTKRGKPPRVPERLDRIDGQGGAGGKKLGVLQENEQEEEEDDVSFKDGSNIVKNKKKEKRTSLLEAGGEKDYAAELLLLGRSSDSSDADAGSSTRVVAFHDTQPSSLTLLDTKGKKRKVILGKKSKKKMRKREKKRTNRNYVKGKVIDGEHELYTLSIAMMLGLRYTIFLTNNQLVQDKRNKRMWLDSDEFMKMEKYIFRPDGRNDTPPHQLSHTFKFKDYSPLPFAFLRRMFGINEYEFHHSVCGNANFIEFISNAKSGQFFFYSSDGKYMIKTMTNAESKFLRRSEYAIVPSFKCHGCLYKLFFSDDSLSLYLLYHLQYCHTTFSTAHKILIPSLRNSWACIVSSYITCGKM
jgi:Phosphatidylinositol-4-phosphate 5-kinase